MVGMRSVEGAFETRFGDVFDMYDDKLEGEISNKALCNLYREMRPPGIRVAQVEAGLETLYGEGMGDSLEKQDLEKALVEMDRRYYLLQDLLWEFQILSRQDGFIDEQDAKLLFTATHEHNFSLQRYERWLSSRRVRGSGVAFLEVDVPLCNIPTPDEIIADLPTVPRTKDVFKSATSMIMDEARARDKKNNLQNIGYMKKLQDLKDKRAENLNRRKSIGDEFKKTEEQRKIDEEEDKRHADEDERKRLEEERILAEESERLALLEKEGDERKRLQELKNLAAKEEAEKRAQEEEERRRAAEEAAEMERLRLEAEQRSRDEEKKRRAEEELRKKQEEAARLAAEEELKLANKNQIELEQRKREEKQALLDKKAAEEALEAAKEADDMEAIEEAQRMKKDADERARISKIMKRLAQAIQRRELNELEEVISEVKKLKAEGVETQLGEAEDLVKLLYAQRQLEAACLDRSIDDIEAALQKIYLGNYQTVLAAEVEEAELLLKRLRRLEFLKRKIMELSQRTIAELKSYSQPPPLVKFVMTATFLILGHKAKEIKQWPQMVVLMGKTGKLGLKRRVQSYDPDNMPWEVAVACKEILVGMDVGMVADVSAGAAAFFVWAEGMVEERLSMPKVITQEMMDRKKSSESPASSSEKSAKYMKTTSGTVDVMSRRSRSIDVIEAPKKKAGQNRNDKPPQGTRAARNAATSRSPAVSRRGASESPVVNINRGARGASKSPGPSRGRVPRK